MRCSHHIFWRKQLSLKPIMAKKEMIDSSTTLAEYIDLNENEDGTWHAEVRDLQKIRDALGEDILVGICRLLVGADRLDSTIRLMHDVDSSERKDHPSSGSDRVSLFLFASATIHEMAKAVDLLSGAFLKNRLSKAGKKKWGQLRKTLNRWNHDNDLRYVRDKMAFHIDENLIRDGVAKLCSEGKPIGFASGFGQAHKDCRTELGTNALLAGSKFDLNAFIDLAKRVFDDHLQVPTMICDVIKEIRFPSLR